MSTRSGSRPVPRRSSRTARPSSPSIVRTSSSTAITPRSVVVPGTRPKEFPAGIYQLSCALIIGRRTESTDLKTSLNDALREYGIGT